VSTDTAAAHGPELATPRCSSRFSLPPAQIARASVLRCAGPTPPIACSPPLHIGQHSSVRSIAHNPHAQGRPPRRITHVRHSLPRRAAQRKARAPRHVARRGHLGECRVDGAHIGQRDADGGGGGAGCPVDGYSAVCSSALEYRWVISRQTCSLGKVGEQ
jgi:hypothetical protein